MTKHIRHILLGVLLVSCGNTKPKQQNVVSNGYTTRETNLKEISQEYDPAIKIGFILNEIEKSAHIRTDEWNEKTECINHTAFNFTTMKSSTTNLSEKKNYELCRTTDERPYKLLDKSHPLISRSYRIVSVNYSLIALFIKEKQTNQGNDLFINGPNEGFILIDTVAQKALYFGYGRSVLRHFNIVEHINCVMLLDSNLIAKKQIIFSGGASEYELSVNYKNSKLIHFDSFPIIEPLNLKTASLSEVYSVFENMGNSSGNKEKLYPTMAFSGTTLPLWFYEGNIAISKTPDGESILFK